MSWHGKATGGYSRLSTEATDNAQMVADMLITHFGWTLEAVCGVCGNMQFEVGFNPLRWQNDNIKSVYEARSTSMGYGLIGWTPARKYLFNNAASSSGVVYFPDYGQESYPGYSPNFSDQPGSAADGYAQTFLIGASMEKHSPNIYLNRTGCSSAKYITLTNVKQAAYHWGYNAEYSAGIDQSITTRQNYAVEIYNWLKEHGYTPSGGHVPIWLLKKISDHNKGVY